MWLLNTQAASYTEVARRTGLTPDAVLGRRNRILEVFQTKSMYEAGEPVRSLGLLEQVPGSAETPLSKTSETHVQTGQSVVGNSRAETPLDEAA